MARRRKTSEPEPSGHQCYWAGCRLAGDYKAPKFKGAGREYQWFCQEHITQFNKSWNFFEGMDEAEIYAFQKESFLGAREEQWQMGGQSSADLHGKMHHAFYALLGESHTQAVADMLPRKTRDALSVLNLEHPSDKKLVKKHYRELVKKYHPDINANDAKAEETFKLVTIAYHYLIEHYCEA
jgi:hypothetical protein